MKRLASLLLVVVMLVSIVATTAFSAFAGEPCEVHDYKATVTTAPTLSAKGVMTYHCNACGDEYTEEIPVVSAQPSVTIDGDLEDSLWANGEWISVDGDNGFYQTLPTTADTLSYKYQIVCDGTYMNVAVVIDCALVEGGNGAGTNVRLWLHNGNEEATVYTHFYDVFKKDGAIATNSKYNTMPTTNKAANIEAPSIEAAMVEVDGTTYAEFRVKLSEFGAEDGFNYHMAVSNKVNENLCLFFPDVELPEGTGRTKVLPYSVWTSEAEPVCTEAPEGAIEINHAGYEHVTDIVQILAGDNMTVGQLTNLGCGAGEKDLNYYYTYIVDEHNLVVEVLETLGRPDGVKTDKVCPKGGYILAVHGNLTKPTINVGDLITLYNVDVEAMRGVAGFQTLTGAAFTAEEHTHDFAEEVTTPATLSADGEVRAFCSCGVSEVKEVLPMIKAQEVKEYVNLALGAKETKLPYGGAETQTYNTSLTDGVALNQCTYKFNEWYGVHTSNSTDKVGVITLDLGEKKTVANTRIHFIVGNASGIQSPAGVKIEVSADGESYTEVVKETYGPGSGSFKYVWYNYSFDATEAQYIRYSITFQGAFSFLNEIEVYGEDAPIVVPEGAIGIDYAGYKHAGAVSIVAGDNMTVAELTKLGYGAERDMNYAKNIVVDKDNIVIATYGTLGTGISNVVCPEGGYIITYNANKGGYAVMDDINVGSIITVANVDIDAIRGVAGNQALVDAYFTYEKHTVHTYEETLVTAPDLQNTGKSEFVCIFCGEKEEREIPAINAQGIPTIDGFVDDAAWKEDAWICVDGDNGFYQTLPTVDSLDYMYQIITDGSNMYVAVVVDCDLVEGGNGAGTNVRLWLHNGTEGATVYTHFYDVCVKAGAVTTVSKYNTQLTSNKAADIADSQINAELLSYNGLTFVEFCVPLAEFGGEEGFSYHMAVSNKVNENICLFYPSVEIPEGAARTSVLPYSKWSSDAVVEIPAAPAEGAIEINNAGYEHVTDIAQILAGDNMTVGQLTNLGCGAGEKDLNYYYTYIVNANNIVVEVLETLGRPDGVKTDKVCPEGGYILVVHGNLTKPTIEVGNLVTLYNIDLDAMRGVAGHQALFNAAFTVEGHEHVFEEYDREEPTFAREGRIFTKCSCGEEVIEKIPVVKTQDFNFALGAVEDKIPYQKNPSATYNTSLTDGRADDKCTYKADEWYGIYNLKAELANADENGVGVITLDLGAVKTISSTRIHFLFGNASGIQSPAAVKVEISADGETYTEVANETYGAPTSSSFTFEWRNYEFEAADAQFVRYSITKQGTFTFLNEIEVYGEKVPEEVPSGAFTLGYAGLYFDAAARCLLAGDGKMTIADLVELGDGESNPLAWWDVVICDADGVVVEAKLDGGSGANTKADLVVPEGGFAIAVHCDGSNETFKAIQVGQVITVHNVDLSVMPGVADSQKLSSAFITIEDKEPEYEEVPEGAIAIDNAGYEHVTGIVQILAGDNMTVGQLTALGCGAEKDLNYYFTYIVDADNKVIEVLETLGRPDGVKTDKVCPEGGYILAVSGTLTKPEIAVGDIITLYNVDLDAIRGAEGFKALTNAAFTVETPEPVFFEKEVDVNNETILTDGTVDVSGNWGSGASTSNVLLIANSECKQNAMKVTLHYALDEAKQINNVILSFYHCAGVMIGYPEGTATVLVSTDGENFVEAGEFAFAEADVAVSTYGTVTSTFNLDGVEAKFIDVVFTVGSNEDVLGATPADNKIFWEFAAMTEFAVEELKAPVEPAEVEVNVNEKDILTDGVVDVSGNWGAGASGSNVLLIANSECKEKPMNVTLHYTLDEVQSVSSVLLSFYHCAGVMIGYPEGTATVLASTDGENFDVVGEFDIAAAEVAVGSYGTVTSTFEFEAAVEAKFIDVIFSVGSNEAVLGATPADNKIFWEFAALTEFEVVAEKAPVEPTEVEINVNEKDILTDGTVDVDGAWGAGASGSNVLLIPNGNCTEAPMNVTVLYDLGEIKNIENVKLSFYRDANVMIGYPEGVVNVFVSTDGEAFESVGEFDLEKADLSLGVHGTVTSTLAFDAVDAQFVMVTFSVGSNEAILGTNPAGGKIFWEFAALTEVEVGVVEADPIAPDDITGDGTVDAFDYQMLKAYALGTYTSATEDQVSRMDINGDGSIDAFDYQMLKCIVLGTYVLPQ